jgi:ATP-dependent RNA helicase DHX57
MVGYLDAILNNTKMTSTSTNPTTKKSTPPPLPSSTTTTANNSQSTSQKPTPNSTSTTSSTTTTTTSFSKGHRQKGAGTKVIGKTEVKRHGLEIKEWQQTPKQLIEMWAKNLKRPKPRFEKISSSKGYLVRCILPDGKNSDKDLIILPTTAFENDIEAEHGVALLALAKVDSTRQHELKLPEPYRTVWLKLVGREKNDGNNNNNNNDEEDPSSSTTPELSFKCEKCGKTFEKAHSLQTHVKSMHPKPKIVQGSTTTLTENSTELNGDLLPFASDVQTETTTATTTSPPPDVVIEKKPSESLLNMKNALKFASQQERRAAELEAERIRAQRRKREEAQERQELEDSATCFMSEDNRIAIEAIIKRFDTSAKPTLNQSNLTTHNNNPLIQQIIKLGFTEPDARMGVGQSDGTLSSALDWLCLHLDEERLPEGFDPRGLQMEVIRPNNNNTTTTTSSKSTSSMMITDNSISSSPLPNSFPDFTQNNIDETTILTFFQSLNLGMSTTTTTISPNTNSNNTDTITSEYETLQAIIGSSEIIQTTSQPNQLFRIYRVQLGETCALPPPPSSTSKSSYLDIFLPVGYPETQSPLCIVWCSPQEHAMAATKLVNRKSVEFIPELSVYSLWDYTRTLTKNEVAYEALAESTILPQQQLQQPSSSTKITTHHYQPTHQQRQLKSQDLLATFQSLTNDSKYISMQKRRQLLPAAAHSQNVIEMVAKHQVVLIRGETGCGKTTQVPQYILEHEIRQGRGGHISMICTQPRRLAAVSVATRVAEEMSQHPVGGLIGYSVQLDSKRSIRDTRLEFVTTGLLLRRLQNDPLLQQVTHVIVDEVHERSVDSDFLLACLKNILIQRRDLKLILMSATMDETAFVQYFNPSPPVLRVPGFTFPVQIEYLEDAMKHTKYCINGTQNLEFNQQVKVVMERIVDYDLLANVVIYASGILDQEEKFSTSNVARGSILIFVSGVAEINKATQSIMERAPKGKLSILPLHGALTNIDQRKVFENVTSPSAPRKVIVATNVAETSITIDDVVFVIDTGRVKEVRYDTETKMTSLVDTWISAASAKQRTGRAGRVRAGYCIRLWSKSQQLDVQQLPEIHRVPLEQCALQVAGGKLGKISKFLLSLVDPPRLEAIQAAVDGLLEIGALEITGKDEVEVLTPLGKHLSELPVDARLGKMLLYGCILGCSQEVLTIAACLSRTRSPFLNPSLEQRTDAERARRALGECGIAGGAQSDHLLLIQAFDAWNNLHSDKERREFAIRNFLSHEGMKEVAALRKEYIASLEKIGFQVGSTTPTTTTVMATSGVVVDANDPIIRKRRQLTKAALIAGLYPRLCRIRKPPAKFVEMSGGALAKAAEAHELKFFDELVGQRVFIHPSSINFNQNKFNSPWLVYTEKFETSKVFLRDTTCVAPYGILLFGGKLEVLHSEGIMTVGDFATFRAPARVGVLIKQLRGLLRNMLDEKLENPSLQFESNPVVDAVKRLIEGDGFL